MQRGVDCVSPCRNVSGPFFFYVSLVLLILHSGRTILGKHATSALYDSINTKILNSQCLFKFGFAANVDPRE